MKSDGGSLTIRLFGTFVAQHAGKPLPELRLRFGESLLAYLLLHHDQPIRATSLAQIFWPEQVIQEGEIEKALGSLRQSIRSLRKALASEGERLETTTGTVTFRADGLATDLIAFDTAIALGDRISLERAVALYKGPLLEGWSERWAIKARERYRDLYVNALQRLADQARATEDYKATARYLRRLVNEVPKIESNWIQLIKALADGGERLEAVAVYQYYRDYLYRHGRLEPSAEVTALFEKLQERPAHIAVELHPDFQGYEPVGGAVTLNSPYYIDRPADAEIRDAVNRRDSILLIKGPRQIGKTSLLIRALAQARQAGARLVLTDLQKLSAADFETGDTFFRALAQMICDQLELDISLEDHWRPHRAPGSNFERFIRLQVLNRAETPLFWGLDEVDRLFPYAYRNDVFGMFRSWHNERSFDTGGSLGRLTLLMAYATEAHLLISDLNQSPFNVGTRVTLQDLTLEQVGRLNHVYGTPLRNASEQVRLFSLAGGHPYLVRRTLHEMKRCAMDIGAVEMQEEKDDGIFGDHLERMLLVLRQDAGLIEVLRTLLSKNTEERGDPICSSETFYRLRSAGIVIGNRPEEMRPRCRLYTTYLTRNLL